MKIVVFAAISATLLNSAFAAHLLAMHMVATGSYVRIMDSLLTNLAQEHKITLYSVVHDDFPHPNVSVVKVHSPPPKNFFFGGLFEVLCDLGLFYIDWTCLLNLQPPFVQNMFDDPNMKKLATTNEKYDAFITFATFSEFTLQFADLLKLPLIEISPTAPLVHVNDAVGNPAFLSTVSSFFTTQLGDTFIKRVQNYFYNFQVYIRYNYLYIPSIESVTKNFFPSGIQGIAKIHRNTSLLLTNTNNAMGYARPNMPNVVEIGGIHCRPAQPLPPDLEEFISGSGEHGIIYLSFGSSIRSKYPEYITQSIIRIAERLPQRILWKWNEEVTNLPSNVRVSKWYSQQDILGHNKTKLFITQSGMFSMQEAAYHGVPVLAIPIAFDQPTNAMLANDLGYCEYIMFCDFTEEEFFAKIQKMLSDPTYRQNAKRVSKLMTDYPLTQSKHMLWWVDYIVRHNGNPLISKLKDKSYGLERLDLDVVLFFFVTITLTLLTVLYILYKLINFIFILKKNWSFKDKKA